MNFISINSDIFAARLFNGSVLPQPIRNLANLKPDGNFKFGGNFKSGDKLNADINNRVCLTFDDGPDPDYTPKILAVLADYDVTATFFVLGAAAEKFPQLVEKMVEAGHTIGNHTYSHQHPWLMTSARAKNEVTRTTNIINDITGNTPRWFRPPFGRLRTAMRRQVHAEQMMTVLWSHSIIDWGLLGTKSGIARRLDYIKPDDIVLMHDGKREHNHPGIMLQCLPGFLRSLSDRSLVACNLDGVS